ncbi:AraC family transcriptional regulator [Actinoalloteichus caeruleus]|uniref:AraC family transcriptional regulator n=1 Tax=Actinoalloteichus cyanogriseus TaxID=2893586 RepID=UPI003AAB2BD8
MSETVFRSEELPEAERFERWRELMASTHAPMELSSEYAGSYRVTRRLIELGPVVVWPVALQPVVMDRTARLVRQSDPGGYHLSYMLGGTLGVSRARQEETEHGPHHFHTTNTSHTYRVHVRNGSGSLIHGVAVELPQDSLPMPRRQSERAIGRRMTDQDGMGAMLGALLRQLAAAPTEFGREEAARLGGVLVDLVAAMFAGVVDGGELSPEARRRNLVLRVKAFARRNLGAPLTPAMLASAHHISVSYLHRLFRDEAETVSEWVRRERLERIRQELRDPRNAGVPIHHLAERRGFGHHAAFSRAFRAAYGMTPRDYRNNPGAEVERPGDHRADPGSTGGALDR